MTDPEPPSITSIDVAGYWWRFARDWSRLPRPVRVLVLRRALRRTTEPKRWVGFAALGWAHREVLSSPWSATCATLLASTAAALAIMAVRVLVRRGPWPNSRGDRTGTMSGIARSGGGHPTCGGGILNLHHASDTASYNAPICCEPGGATVIGESDKMAPDAIATLLGQVRSGTVAARERAARDMLVAVHRAVHPMCLKLLGNADDALEAEAESVARLLARGDDREAAPIINGAAYVRQIARNVCADLHRESRRRHDRSLDDLDEDQLPWIPDHASTMNTPVAVPTPLDHQLIATFGYTSQRALADLECLTRRELQTVVLRQEGYSYAAIAGLAGDGLTTGAAEKQGERGLHTLRGMVHVGVWRQEAPAAWTDPPCPVLAELQGQVKQQLQDGKKITATLYRQIGRHLDPDPNRASGNGPVPLCPLCVAQRERSRREYWWLLIMLMPFPASAAPSSLRPVSLNGDAEPPRALAGAAAGAVATSGAQDIRTRRYRRALWTAAAVVLLLLLAVGALVAPRIAASTGAPPLPTGPTRAGAPPGRGGAAPGTATPAPSAGGPGTGPGGIPAGSVPPGSAGPPGSAPPPNLPPVGTGGNRGDGGGGITFAGLADWNGDDHPDILMRDGAGTLWLYPGDGQRRYSSHPPVRMGDGWGDVTFAGIADWDGDGHQDILARDAAGDLWLYPGDGDGGYRRPPARIGNGWNDFTFAGIADWDNNDCQDIMAKDSAGALWVYPGDCSGGFSQPPVQIGNGWNDFTFAGLADWDGDLGRRYGGQDILARDGAGTLWLYPGDSTLGYSRHPRVQIGNGWNGFTFAGLADWNGDGHQDIVARDPTGLLWLYLGQGVAEYRGLARVQIGNGW
jgi:DNA-directed RNA polymerase specialized sigma24 family protein